ncbi:pro-opiomelanocortin-1-like isoform X2 [Brienomyrus brachyistius]|uniref:proopiomelanocortin a isoform X2 n=1 Tax=Brienomyrus brachyistius TaxID=42636 RepID=UPI0020B3DC9B|nr:proopiomelanocortin a isoform X2 [Brienomyrus brachyistius]XP_048830723.1 pro-opiomelanocortin-1-like isoform X2 [Brienomyrus brachyistius]
MTRLSCRYWYKRREISSSDFTGNEQVRSRHESCSQQTEGEKPYQLRTTDLLQERKRKRSSPVSVVGLTMVVPAWLLAVAMLCAHGQGVTGQCWEHTKCRDLSSEKSIQECIEQCRSDLTAESPIYPGNGHLHPQSESDDGDGSVLLATLPTPEEETLTGYRGVGLPHENKRSYSMEHFRWGKPVGRKRRPIKVYAGVPEEEATGAYPEEERRDLLHDLDYALGESNLASEHPQSTIQEKKNRPYKMSHFRWNEPPASKRYGGFMKSWDEHSQKPLLTLFRNVIIKDAQQKKDTGNPQ